MVEETEKMTELRRENHKRFRLKKSPPRGPGGSREKRVRVPGNLFFGERSKKVCKTKIIR